MSALKNYAGLTEDFLAEDFTPDAFTHEDHVGVAYELLTSMPFLDAAMLYAKSIRALAARLGAADKFNVTITLAFMSIIAERMQGRSFDSYDAFIAQNSDLHEKNLLDAWYPPETLASENSRNIFLMPTGTRS